MLSFLEPFLKKFLGKEPKVRAHVIVKGHVFDGSYHVFAEQQARNYGLRGWLKVRDGLSASAFLELEVEGPDEKMKNFIMDLRKGNKDSSVSLVTVEWKPTGNPPFSGFSRLL
jgi:acylphosphatase